MKLQKRGDASQEPSGHEQPAAAPKGKKPVIVYIMILFIVAFLLMALSLFMNQRSSSEAMGQLQSSVTNLQEVQSMQEKIIDLQDELVIAKDQLRLIGQSVTKTQEENEALSAENEALLALYSLQQQYAAGNLDACRTTMAEMEKKEWVALLPQSGPRGTTAPAERYEQLKEAIEQQSAQEND